MVNVSWLNGESFFTKGSLPGVSGRRLRAVTNFSSKLYIDPHKHSFYIGYSKQEKQERKAQE